MPSTSDSSAPAAASTKPAIVINDISKTFKIRHATSVKETFVAALQRKEISSLFRAIDQVSFDVPEGQSVALMGRNGSGKSTTLKMVSGVLRPDTGWIRTRGRIAGLLEVGAGFNPNLTGRDNVYLNAAILGMSREETTDRFEEILEFSEIGEFIDTEVKFYSSGMYSRLGFSVAVHTELDILLVDEILSVGDAAFRRKCDEKMLQMRAEGKTMFVVSHNANQVRRLCERGIVLEHGKLVFDGDIESAIDFLNQSYTPELPFAVTGEIGRFYMAKRSQFGRPLGPEVPISENGGGAFQEFEHGIITSSAVLPSDRRTQGITKGVFHSAYLRAGGPAGSWGFIAGSPRGSIEKFETRMMRFQNGTAGYSIDEGLSFD